MASLGTAYVRVPAKNRPQGRFVRNEAGNLIGRSKLGVLLLLDTGTLVGLRAHLNTGHSRQFAPFEQQAGLLGWVVARGDVGIAQDKCKLLAKWPAYGKELRLASTAYIESVDA